MLEPFTFSQESNFYRANKYRICVTCYQSPGQKVGKLTISQLCSNCNPSEDDVYIQVSDNQKYLVDSSNHAKMTRDLI